MLFVEQCPQGSRQLVQGYVHCPSATLFIVGMSLVSAASVAKMPQDITTHVKGLLSSILG